MTQHKATPEQWNYQEQAEFECDATASCLLELRDRISALEAQRETEKACIQEIYEKLDRLKVQHESNWSRIVKLEERPIPGTVELRQQVPAPTGGLVDRVAQAIADDDAPVDLWLTDASAAILAVAEWFDAIGYGATASMLRQEVERG